MLIPFLSEDFTDVVNGWKPKVSSVVVKGEYRGFGEPSVYWMLDYVELPALPPAILDCIDVSGQCEVDTVGFVFQKSEGAAMSQKAQRRFARQKKVEVAWAGPAVVCDQRTERRVPIGHRGSGMRKALFESSDEDSSDGTGDSSGGGFEGGCSRAENKARQRPTIIRQDKAEVERREAAKQRQQRRQQQQQQSFRWRQQRRQQQQQSFRWRQ